jgi:site-specific recombinase XerD
MVTKELLGHANVNTTQKYIGVGMDALRAAVDAI